MIRRHPLSVIAAGTLLASIGVTGLRAQEQVWLAALRSQLVAERTCDMAYVVHWREFPLAGAVSIEGRAQCRDGRMFDFSQPNRHQKFQLRLCAPVYC